MILFIIIIYILYLTGGILNVLPFVITFITLMMSHFLLITNPESKELQLIRFSSMTLMVIIITVNLNDLINILLR